MYVLHCSRSGKVQKRGKFNFIGRLQLSTETSRQEENEEIVALRVLRVQVRYLKLLLKCRNALIQHISKYNQRQQIP